jgi:hypothetical protein
MKSFPTKIILLAASLCVLAACGGGDDDSTAAAPPPPPATPPVAGPTFDACFEVTEGVAYTMTDPDEGGVSDGVLMVKEAFEGAVRSASVELADATSIRRAATYWSQEADGIRFWGSIDYDEAGVAQAKMIHSDGFVLPLTMQAGQSTDLSYTVTIIEGGQTDTVAQQETWTFEGFETLTLGGKSFDDTCRIKTTTPQAGGDGPSTLWFAKGFGLIRARHTDSSGGVVEESELESITAQP